MIINMLNYKKNGNTNNKGRYKPFFAPFINTQRRKMSKSHLSRESSISYTPGSCIIMAQGFLMRGLISTVKKH